MRTSNSFLFSFSSLYFGDVFNKTIIPLAIIWYYYMIIANAVRSASLAICSLQSYPKRIPGIIVNYTTFLGLVCFCDMKVYSRNFQISFILVCVS